MQEFNGSPDHLLPYGKAQQKHSPVKFLILQRDKAPVEADPKRLERSGWIGHGEDWFKDEDEIAPGVKAKFLGYGDQFDKDHNAVRGALVAVWYAQAP